MTLAEIAAATGGRLDGGADPAATVRAAVTLDSRAVEPGGLYVALVGARVDGHDFAAAAVAAGAVAVLAGRPVGMPAIVVEDPVLGLGRLGRAVRERVPGLTVIGVTGSVGKTSTKDLLAAVLARAGRTVAPTGNFNNEFGVPLTTLRVDAKTEYLVSEMGARGIGHIAYLCGLTRPDIGLVLNVGTAHSAVFGGPDGIAQGKGELVEALPASGLAVLNADDRRVAAMVSRTAARVVFTSVRGTEVEGRGPAEIRAEKITLDDQARAGFELITPAGSAPVRLLVHGEHQVANALAAAAVGIELGLAPSVIAEALSAAGRASPWRMEIRHRADGLVVVNDAYNANPDSVAAALRALVAMSGPSGASASSGHWAVLGEMVELGPAALESYRGVGRLAVELGLSGIIAIGPEAVPVADGARDAIAARAGSQESPAPQVHNAADLDEARALVQHNVRRTDVLLIKASRVMGLERLAAEILGEIVEEAT